MEEPKDYFGEKVAATYDGSTGVFEPGAVNVTVGLLAELARGGRALEPFTGDSSQHVSVWEKPAG